MTTGGRSLGAGEDAPGAWLPEAAPLRMPAQDFAVAPRPGGRRPIAESEWWQVGQLALSLGVAVLGAVSAAGALASGGVTWLEAADVGLFTLLFAWIAYALAGALIGFGVSIGEIGRATPRGDADRPRSPRGRTAILAPVHNEDPGPVCRRLRNMNRSLQALGLTEAFDVFVLSDTRDADIAAREAAAVAALQRDPGVSGAVYYRRRAVNTGRKAGNIADWVRRFGGAYDYMVVLDADSVMEGETLARLAAMMDADASVGLIQTVPHLVNRLSVFGRLQQFSARLYGPMLGEGLAQTSGACGNYWGHNAIIRVRAFADHAGLPVLKGVGPWGGEIMSHDFVEAALLRRAGWGVRLAPELTGSYEECPPSLTDLIIRDRRWCRGNIQHLPLIGATGLHWLSRVHLAKGVLTYAMAPVWLLFLVVGAGLTALSGGVSGGDMEDYALDTVNWLLALSVVGLFLPRLLALARVAARPQERASWGSPARLCLGVLFEACASAVISPILLTSQTLALAGVLMGRHGGWGAQRRGDETLRWSQAARLYAPHTLLGAVMAGAALGLGGAAAFWLAPVVLGLVLSVPIAVTTSDPALGAWLLRYRILATPEELRPPAILAGLAPAAPLGAPRIAEVGADHGLAVGVPAGA